MPERRITEDEAARAADHAARNERDRPRLEARRRQLIQDQASAKGEWKAELGQSIAWIDHLIALTADSCEGEGNWPAPRDGEHIDDWNARMEDAMFGPQGADLDEPGEE